MADFKTHWQVGLGASAAGALIANWLKLAPPKLVPLLVVVGWIGSIAPDLDSDTGRPLKLIFNGLAALLPPVLLWRLPWLHESAERALLFWAVGALLIQGPLKWLFKTFTKHRGVIHSVPAAFIFGGVCFLLAHHESAERPVQWAVSLVAVIGYLAHLLLDEFWAVDFNGKALKVKRSFGSAFSWRGKSRLQTFALYATLALVWWSCYTLWAGLPLIPDEVMTFGRRAMAWLSAAEPLSLAWWRELSR